VTAICALLAQRMNLIPTATMPRAKLFALQLLGIGVQEAIRRPELAVAKRGQSIFRRFDILLSGGTITALEWRSSEITGLNLE